MGTAPGAPGPSLSPRRLEAGVRLGRFELLSLIAQGGMGAVWAARPIAGERNELVAVKTILPEEASDPAVRAMFLDEARVASLIAHPNACAVIDYGNDEGTLYIVMEWVDGDSLRSLLRGSEASTVPCDIALRILRGACDALHAAHDLTVDGESLGLVHRDVSPHNILVGTAGDVKLIDFGIAKTRARLSETTNSGVVKGKLRYLAPEQVDGTKIDRRADVWALGAVLWSLVCGQEIYGDMGEAEIFRTLVLRDGMPKPPNTLPPAVLDILGRALAYDPKKRFESAQAMREAIDATLGAASPTSDRAIIGAFAAQRLQSPIALKRTSIEDARASLSNRARSTRSRRRWRHAAFGSVALAAIAAIGSVAFASRTSGAPPVNVGRADIAQVIDDRAAAPEATAPPAPTPPLPSAATTASPTAVKAGPASRAPSPDKKRPKTPVKAKSSTKLGAEFDTHD